MPAQVPQTELFFRHDGKELFRVTLPPGQYTIGRNPDVQIYVNTPLLSRRHARLTIDQQHLLIEDLGSSNGTFIDNQPVSKVTRLKPHQAIRLGDVQLEIRRRDQHEPQGGPAKSPKPKKPASVPPPPASRTPSPAHPPAPAKRTQPKKSKGAFYAALVVVLAALGAAAFYFWPRPEKLTQAEMYAKAHPTEQSPESAGVANQNGRPAAHQGNVDSLIEALKSALAAADLQGLKNDAVSVSPSGKISVNLKGTSISDLAVLSRYPIDELQLGGSKVTKLDPVRTLPLVTLSFDNTGVTDAQPLTEIGTLENVVLGKALTNLETLRASSNIQRLSYDSTSQGARLLPSQTAAEFWKNYDKEKAVRAPAIAALQKMGIKSVTEQKLSVNKAGKLEINLSGQPVSDLTPLAGLPIARLNIGVTKISDLAPLHGMALQGLSLNACAISDLTPLHGQPIVDLIVGVKDWKKPNEGKTKVSDLSPVRGMPLHKISLDGALSPDVTPLTDCPSVQIVVLPADARNVDALRKLPNLKKISWGYPGSDEKMPAAAAFWKEYDAKKKASPPAATAGAGGAAAGQPGAPVADLGADAEALAAAKQKRLELLAKFEFTEAHDAILAPNLQNEVAHNEQELLGKKARWLATFKSQLIEDLNKAGGYAQPVASKSGVALPGAIVQADDQQLMLRTARGLVPVPWTEISPDSLFAMASSFIEPKMPKEIAAFRKWHLGVFASFAGKKEEALTLLKEAADLKPVYKDEVMVFERPSNSW